MTVSELQQAINKIKERQLPLSELRECLTHPSRIIRANAVVAFAAVTLCAELSGRGIARTYVLAAVRASICGLEAPMRYVACVE